MATIRKRGEKYQVQVRRKGLRSINRSFHTYKDAEAWSRQMEVQADRQELPPDPSQLRSITLRDLVIRYRDTVSPSKRTGSYEQLMLNAFLRRSICSLSLSELRTAHFATYRDERLALIKPSSLARELVPIRHMFEIARKEWGLPLRENPLSALSLKGSSPRRERRLGPDELERLIDAAKLSRTPLLIPIILFALVTGMRRGEILGTRWQDVDWATKSLLIPSSKNGYPRVIPLVEEALHILDRLPRKAEHVFPMHANALRLSWGRLRRRAGCDDLHFHDLRHEAISRFFEAGLSTPEVALISGHRDPRMLFRYTHPLRERILAQLSQREVLGLSKPTELEANGVFGSRSSR